MWGKNEGNHDSRAVANKLIERGLKENKRFTPLQIIKLVYFCHGWMLGIYGQSLFTHKVRAWTYGPVIAEVYRELRQYGGNQITSRIPGLFDETFTDMEEDIISQVYEKYGDIDGIGLSSLTHAPETPWAQVWYKRREDSVIPNNLIKKYYARKFADVKRRNPNR